MDLGALFHDAGCDGALHGLRLEDGLEVEHDSDRLQVMASVVKVPIALEYYSRVADGQVDPATVVTLDPAKSTPGPVGTSRFGHAVTASVHDLAYLMLTISDNAATDAVTDVVGVDAVNARLRSVGCRETVVVSDLRSMLDGVATDIGFSTYRELLRAQNGELGPDAAEVSTDAARIDRCRALDPTTASRTTARDMTRLLACVWADTAAPKEACATLRSVMREQVTRRLAAAVIPGGSLAAKSGALFGRVRNEIAAVTDPDKGTYAVAVLTRAHVPFAGQGPINDAMAVAAMHAINHLRQAP